MWRRSPLASQVPGLLRVAEPRYRKAWAVVLAAILCNGAAVAEPPSNPHSYRLAPGDKIAVQVFGQSELSGDVVIDVTGSILMPFAGAIEVADLTVSEAHKRIVERLADGILIQPSVNVRISELRPVFLLGDVRSGGAQPFRFGMTVKTAVAVAGGYGVAPIGQGAPIPDLLLSQERVKQLALQKQILTLRRARLVAQRDGADAFAPPAQHDLGEGDLSDIIALEKETFESQTAAHKSQLDLIRDQRPRINSEIGALTAQVENKRKQLGLVKQHADQYSQLVKRGLGIATSEMQMRLTESTYESEIWNLNTQIARLQMDLGTLDLKIQEIDAAFKRQTLADLREVRERLQDLEVTLPIAREIREAKLSQASTLIGDGSRAVTVTRSRSSGPVSLSADEMMLLEPGDIVEVHFRLPREPRLPGASAVRTSDTGHLTPSREAAALPAAPR